MKQNQTTFLKLCLADALIKLMARQRYDSIGVNAICELAQVGRTTFYRHLDKANSKEELLLFKICYEWKQYADLENEDVKKNKGEYLTRFIYENRKLFTLLYENGLVSVIMKAMEMTVPDESDVDFGKDKNTAYLMSFFIYGYFGVIYQWIKYGFDETPEEVQKHIIETIAKGMEQGKQ